MMGNGKQLDLVKAGYSQVFSEAFVDGANVDLLRIAAADAYKIFVSGKLYGERSLKEYEFKYPSDWWQAVKERFAPAWFLRRYPVVYTHHNITVDAVYPELSRRLKLPKEPHQFILSGYSRKDGETDEVL